jgi:5-methylcytosine-specific restriction endonuclease McrA
MKHRVFLKNVPADCYAASVLLREVYQQMETRTWSRARNAFLDSELKQKGYLECYYCHRKPLHRCGGKSRERATIDHILPVSKGGNIIDRANFVVCCDSCNRKKSNHLVEKFVNSKYLAMKLRQKWEDIP